MALFAVYSADTFTFARLAMMLQPSPARTVYFDAHDAPPEPVLSSKEVGPLKVQFVELAGDFMAMGAPAPKKDFLQIAAIVQAEGRNVFFRLVGPKATIEANREAFMKMIDGLMPAD